MILSSGPSQITIGKLEVRQIRTAVLTLRCQDSIGPSGVAAQLNSRTRRTISLSVWRNSGIVVSSDFDPNTNIPRPEATTKPFLPWTSSLRLAYNETSLSNAQNQPGRVSCFAHRGSSVSGGSDGGFYANLWTGSANCIDRRRGFGNGFSFPASDCTVRCEFAGHGRSRYRKSPPRHSRRQRCSNRDSHSND